MASVSTWKADNMMNRRMSFFMEHENFISVIYNEKAVPNCIV
jgi:hypothetical protein